MDSFEYLVVGSGPSGVAAAQILAGPSCAVIDVAEQPRHRSSVESLDGMLSRDNTVEALGQNWEMLSNLCAPERVHPKLRAANLRYVADGEPATIRHDSNTTICHGSYAQGGLAAAWGAQLLRYSQADLDACGDWPISILDLAAHYTRLETEIGISGASDDLADFAPIGTSLLPPAPRVGLAESLLSRYSVRRAQVRRLGLTLGAPRLAVLTRPYQERPAHTFGELDFFATEQPGIYSPVQTLNKLVAKGGINYLPGVKLLSFREVENGVECECLATKTREIFKIFTRHLVLGCGVLHTAKLILEMYGSAGRSLPFQDHVPMLLPLFLPREFGKVLPNSSYPIQAMGCFSQENELDMISLYYCGGMLRSDLLADIPLPFSDSLRIVDYLLGGMLVAQLWRRSRPSASNRLTLTAGGSIQIDYPDRPSYPHARALARAFRKLGAYTSSRMARASAPGWGFHYAGTLPMRKQPAAFETYADGRLWNSQRIRVVDGSVLPSLPSKNHSLTLMANAARIASDLKSCGY